MDIRAGDELIESPMGAAGNGGNPHRHVETAAALVLSQHICRHALEPDWLQLSKYALSTVSRKIFLIIEVIHWMTIKFV